MVIATTIRIAIVKFYYSFVTSKNIAISFFRVFLSYLSATAMRASRNVLYNIIF